MPPADPTVSGAQTEPLPHWFWVGAGVGLVAGVSSVAFGWLLAAVGNELDLHACQNDAGCLAIFAIGLFEAPFCAAAGALAGGLTAAAARTGACTARTVWKRSFGFGFLAALLGAVVGWVALPAILR